MSSARPPDQRRGSHARRGGAADRAGVRDQPEAGGPGGDRGESGYRRPRHAGRRRAEPGAAEPGSRERGYPEPEYQDTGSRETGSQETGYQETGYQETGYGSPTVAEAWLGAPGYGLPGSDAPGLDGPGSGQPSYGRPGYARPESGDPRPAPPGNGGPGYGGASHSAPVPDGPGHGGNRALTRGLAAGLYPAAAPSRYPPPPDSAPQSPDLHQPAIPGQLRVPRQPGPVSAPFVAPAGPALGQADKDFGRANSDLQDDPPATVTPTLSHRRHGRTPAREARPGGRRTWVPRTRPGIWRGLPLAPRTLLLLGAGLLVAVGVIVAIMFLGSGPAGPAHTLVIPARLGAYQRRPELARQMGVSQLEKHILAQSSGQVSHLVSAVYQNGASVALGPAPQVMLFIGGQLTGASADAAIKTFTQHFRYSVQASPGRLGGRAACVPGQASTGGAAVCAWFDNDTFGELVSPNMTASALASELRAIRPSIELLAK